MQDCVAGQTLPHVPQLLGSVFVLMQRPPQFVAPPGHAQAPFTQTNVGGHMRPQAPQLFVSKLVLMQRPPQFVVGGAHPQLPAMHDCVAAQVLLHIPQ
jgi:hypothetical protein